ncbi:MAG: hypothetical protein R3E01_05265 [Pirellulaceae bacterium]|nr:hypothetical protein [Planctomycetales bacterium]
MPDSVLEAIRMGIWDFEPEKLAAVEFEATRALPGSDEKLTVLAERLRAGIPLWHPNDRRTYEDVHEELHSENRKE